MSGAAVYVPEIHDLAPGMAPLLDRMIAAFPPSARSLIAYSVVPNWQGAQPLDAFPEFALRLRGLQGEKVLHGWTHSLGPDAVNWLLYGHDNRSEFRALGAEETARRLDLGAGMMARAVGPQRWFCAPRWQGNPHLAAALAARGFRGVLEHRRIIDFSRGPVPIPALNFDEGARTLKISAGLPLRAMAIGRLLRRRQPFRLVLHPDDMGRRAVMAQFHALVARLQGEGWTPMSLEQAVAGR